MRRLIEWIKRLFGLGEDNEILDDDDYDPAMIMHYMRPEEKTSDRPGGNT